MIYFNCPHCAHAYHDDDMLEQEHVLIEDPMPLSSNSYILCCPNCQETFMVARHMQVTFEVIAK